MASSPYVVPLAGVGAGDVAVAGGKGANLGELLRAGFRVPAGFVVSTRLYADALRAASLDPSVPAEASDAAALEDAVRTVELPALLRDAVLDAHHALGGGPVAVRSSATAEDLPGAAFAGQQETFLGVVGDEAVLDALRACWASLWGERAVAYRRKVGFTGVPEIAVVVQRMVPAAYAGVLFTADPVTGARDRVVIEANPGLGEAVVSGLVTPEHVVVDRRGRVVERRAGRREVVIRSQEGGGTVRHEHPDEDPDEDGATLGVDVLRDLAATGRRVADHFGRPQDVEWAWADDEVWLVQARPLTALPPAPIRTSALQRATGGILVELLPSRPFPLDLTAWTAPGWFTILARMALELPGVRVDVGRMLPAEDGILTELRPAEPRLTWRTLTTAWRLWPKVRRFDPGRWTEDPRFAAYERALEDLQAVDWSAVAWSELTAVPARVLDLLAAFVDLRIDHLPRVVVDVVRLRVLLGLLGLGAEFWPLAGGAPTRTRAANEALADLARRVRDRPEEAALFSDLGDADLVAAVWEREEGAPLRKALQGWLRAYGHRETTSAALVSAPTWDDDPALLLGHLRTLVTRPAAVPVEDQAAAATARVRRNRLVRATGTADLVLRAAEAARAGLGFREDSHFHALRLRPVLRAALLEAGARLRDAGVLTQVDEVFHLQLAELCGAREPARLDEEERQDLRGRVRRRTVRRAELGNAPLMSPATLHPRVRRARTDALVSGTPGGGGRATGPVRVVRGPGDFGRLQRGEVLVCPYTNPAWTPLFALAAAVVADSGSSGSHAAIVAREYGIPAVMGTGDGTRALADGRRVVVDGDRGVVVAADGAGRGRG